MGGLPLGRRRPLSSRSRRRESTDPCDIDITVDLIGVRRGEAVLLRRGDVLAVQILKQDGASSAVCVGPGGGVVGSLAAFPGLSSFLDCLAGGELYLAVVEESAATRCLVHVLRVVA